MSRGGKTRFQKGQTGNSKGRSKKPPVPVSAWNIVLDQTVTVPQDGGERELTVEEALELKTFQTALQGNRMSVRWMLKAIKEHDEALAKLRPPEASGPLLEVEYDADNAEEAMGILGISNRRSRGSSDHGPAKLQTRATQAALSRRGRRRRGHEKSVEEIEGATVEPQRLRWPRGTQRLKPSNSEPADGG